VFPSVLPLSVALRVAYPIIRDGLSVVCSEQIAPLGVGVAVIYRAGRCGIFQTAGGVDILLTAQDIAAAILGIVYTIPVSVVKRYIGERIATPVRTPARNDREIGAVAAAFVTLCYGERIRPRRGKPPPYIDRNSGSSICHSR